MGSKILEIFDQIEEKYGTIGLYRLIVKMRMSREKASKISDDEQTIERIKKAIKDLGFEYVDPLTTQSRFASIKQFIRRRFK